MDGNKATAHVGVKFCGGCREAFSRRAEFGKVRERFADDPVEFVLVEDGGAYDALLVLCGCSSCCADTSHYRAGATVKIDSEDSLMQALDVLDLAIRGAVV